MRLGPLEVVLPGIELRCVWGANERMNAERCSPPPFMFLNLR